MKTQKHTDLTISKLKDCLARAYLISSPLPPNLHKGGSPAKNIKMGTVTEERLNKVNPENVDVSVFLHNFNLEVSKAM